MRRFPLRFSVPALGAFIAVAVAAAAVVGLAPAAHQRTAVAQSTAKPHAAVPATITVTAGKPSELAFKLSKTSMVPAGKITFKVTNQGVAFHNFRICSKPVASATAATNACSGKTTPTLKHGESATLTVTISKTGKYEFLCTVSGHAQAGMKGLIGIGVAVSGSEEKAASTAGASSNTSGSGGTSTSTPSSTTPATTSTRPSSGSGNGGDTSGCPAGVTIRTSGAADADGDELGTEPDDNDGCV
jgi:uncharacterized cupredoxin-like copper-binding protein